MIRRCRTDKKNPQTKVRHKVISAINIKNEEKGSTNPEMAMVWDEDKQEYVLTYVNNTEQRSIFDSDFQEAMNGSEDKEPGVPLLEGEVIDEDALPGPVDGEESLDDFHEDDVYGYEDAVNANRRGGFPKPPENKGLYAAFRSLRGYLQ